jgi:streptomycin 6-kinase
MSDHLHRYLHPRTLREPELPARRPTGDIYTAFQGDEKVVLKLLTPVGVEDEADGVAALRYFDGQGAVRLLAYDERAHVGVWIGRMTLELP